MKTKFKGILTLLLAFVMQMSFAQEKTISGTVSDDSGVLPGVSILIKGTNKGTETDFDGKYSIKAKSGDRLVYRYLGYKVVNKTVGNSNVINVTLVQDANVLDEIVVTGVARGTSTKKLGFSLAKVSTKELQEVPAADPANALRGKVAGVRIVQPSGNPSSAPQIRLRGSTSISGSQSPLIIVDGIITNGSLRDVAVEDIASMEVVKGAAAASLYGSLAANGVIQIITKKGKGKLNVTLRSEYGFSALTSNYPVTNKHSYLNDPLGVRDGDWDNDPATPNTSNFGFDLSSGNRVLDPDGLFDNNYLSTLYDNVDNLFESQDFTVNTLSLSGSEDIYNYYLSFQDMKQGGALEPVPPYKRQSIRANFGVKPSEKFEIKFTGSLTKTDGQSITEQGQGANYFYSALTVEPFINLTARDAQGNFQNSGIPGYDVQAGNFQNPLYVAQEQIRDFYRNRTLLGVDLLYDLTEDIQFSFSQSMDRTSIRGFSYNPKGFETPTPSATLNNGFIGESETKFQTNVTGLQGIYSKTFGDLNFAATVKYLFESRTYNALSASGFDIIASGVLNVENTLRDNQSISSQNEREIARNYFVNLDFDYKNKLILNVLGRRDESSLFGSEERSKYYGRGSLAYRLTEDIEINNVQELKFRAAYGTSGLRPPAWNAQYETYSVTTSGISPGVLGNNKLKPSVSAELELGLNAVVFDKINVEFNYSDTKTKDAVVLVPLPSVAGFSAQYQNIGEISSKYFEVSINGNIIDTEDFKWNFGVNFDTGTQEISNLNGVPAFTRGGLGAVNLFRVEEGLPYGTMYGQSFVTSVADLSTDANGEVLNFGGSGTVPGGSTGDYSVNSDGYVVLTSAIGTAAETPVLLYDEQTSQNKVSAIGDTNPDFNVGFNTSFNYKGFSLYALIDWQKGGDIYNYTKQNLYFNERHSDLESFGAAGKHLQYAQNIYNRAEPTSYFVEDGSYVKVREIALGYTLNTKEIGVDFIDSVKFSVSGRNLFTFTDYSGWDPEVAIATNPTNFRLDEYAYPNLKSFSFTAEIKF
ncbi:SusC/RagA family TonB-linked outer membrane protein [Polaribacter haliotis]|uniref:SusC/RagA family TonB-linked outer membrane protein n=1 Tax=Polaribacter haliotis TaxID=1888915 RepID=A0A7L8AJT3_9FLAO|nr:SusC/RagA family TonB-linked outer membrane protein [Polaribacter haliotis]QOD62278.1 SusC/RagA family TonB-linked outer membrane protein [Polaribacter haliotis]